LVTTATRSNMANFPSGNRSARYFSFSSRTLASVRQRTAPNTPRLKIPLQIVRVRLILNGFRRRARGVRLSVTALSYDGQFAISLLADNSMPDLPVLAAGVRAAFEGLRQHRIGAVTTCTGPSGSSSWAMARRWNGMPNSAMLFNRFRCWRGIMMRWRAALDGSDRLVQSQGNGCATDATDCRSTPGRAATSAIAPTK
jgi:hypothetical protein